MSPSFGDDERAISPVVGATLLIGLSVITMGIVGLAVFQFDVLTETPEADLVFDEAEDGSNLTVGVQSINTDDLSKSDVTLSVRGEGCSETWEGSGTLSQGDTNEFTDCSFDDGDILQVIGRNALLDSYEASNQG